MYISLPVWTASLLCFCFGPYLLPLIIFLAIYVDKIDITFHRRDVKEKKEKKKEETDEEIISRITKGKKRNLEEEVRSMISCISGRPEVISTVAQALIKEINQDEKSESDAVLSVLDSIKDN